jgi:cellulose synthase/poly-beta-1,6-N-acetylglucosamine synthase-like glycosyltransferase
VRFPEGEAADRLVSVVVPSHRRPDGLTTLLDALAAQTLDRARWDIVIVHTYAPEVARRLLDGHELGKAGILRQISIDPGSARATTQRNLGWRAARATLVAFTDDDCRPTNRWLEELVERALEYPGAIVQGTTRPDPRHAAALASPHVRTIWVESPGRNTQTCNILYERALLERIGGFDERFPAPAGEDVDLALRAQAAGAVLVGAPEAVMHHAADALTLGEKLRHDAKWETLPLLIKRHPDFRWQQCVFGLWWRREHFGAMLALAALAAAPRRPWALAGLWPYYRAERRRYGGSPRQRLRALREMPAHWLVEIAEIGRFVRGSARYRTLVL